jgi:myo-inositol catabolism protein IolC
MSERSYRPSRDNPLLIMAMDHRESFGRTLFDVKDDKPDTAQRGAMKAAKRLIYAGLERAAAQLPCGRGGVLVDERYGEQVIEAAHADHVVLAVPVEHSGREWFELEWGQDWRKHVEAARPDFAKVLVRDNPGFPKEQRDRQLSSLRRVSEGLAGLGVPMLYELLVPATDDQLSEAGGQADAYDRDIRSGLVVQVIADNQAAGVEPSIWKVEGLETADAARAVVGQMRAAGREHVDAIVLGRDAPAERLDRWLAVAAPVDGFVGFAIGRSIWEEPIADHNHGKVSEDETVTRIAGRYLGFAGRYCTAQAGPGSATSRPGPPTSG